MGNIISDIYIYIYIYIHIYIYVIVETMGPEWMNHGSHLTWLENLQSSDGGSKHFSLGESSTVLLRQCVIGCHVW